MDKTATLISELKRDPTLLYELHPRQFEELVAELLASFGWEVSVTPLSGDGGYDMMGVHRDPSGLESTYLIECKRYRSDRKVDVGALRSLHGLKRHLGFANAAVITTSSFTREAAYFGSGVGDIKLIDHDHLVGWLNNYKMPPSRLPYLSDRRFFSCFISHSHKDQEFTGLLVQRLRENGVKIWYSPDDMLPGRKLGEEVFKAISAFDKLLVVLSEDSIESEWVKSELRRARNREIRERRRILFPVSTAPFSVVRKWECFDADTGKDLAVELREYLILDFSEWRTREAFEKQLQKLLLGLQATGEAV